MTTRPDSRPRGAALATALMLTMVLLMLGMSFLTFCQRDLQFQRRQQASNQAQNLARAGVEHYNYLSNKLPSQAPAHGATLLIEVVPGQEQIELQRLTTGNQFISRGRVLRANGEVISERAVVVTSSGSYDLYL